MGIPELNTVSAPKTATFQMRINPEVKQKAESIFAAYGLDTDGCGQYFYSTIAEHGGPSFFYSPLKTQNT